MRYLLTSVILLTSVVLLGCDSSDVAADESAIEGIVIQPDSASVEVGEQVDFSFAALTTAGDTITATDLDVRWWSTDSTVFTVDDSGTATAQDSGKAFCMIETTDLAKVARFVGRDSATVVVFLK